MADIPNACRRVHRPSCHVVLLERSARMKLGCHGYLAWVPERPTRCRHASFLKKKSRGTDTVSAIAGLPGWQGLPDIYALKNTIEFDWSETIQPRVACTRRGLHGLTSAEQRSTLDVFPCFLVTDGHSCPSGSSKGAAGPRKSASLSSAPTIRPPCRLQKSPFANPSPLIARR